MLPATSFKVGVAGAWMPVPMRPDSPIPMPWTVSSYPGRGRNHGWAINSHERYLTLKAHYSPPLSFNDALIIIMRFAAFVAFTLPLTAFAAPRPTSRQLDSADEFAGAMDRFRLASTDANSAIDVMIDQLSESQNPQELVISEGVQVASLVSHIAILATTSIVDRVQRNGPILEIEYVVGFCAYTMVKNGLSRRFRPL